MIRVLADQDNVICVVGVLRIKDACVRALCGEYSAPLLNLSQIILKTVSMLQDMVEVDVP